VAGNFILLNVFLAIAVDNLSTDDDEGGGEGEEEGGGGGGGGGEGEEKGGQPEEGLNDPPPLYMEVSFELAKYRILRNFSDI
jgi:hypothetical protein